MLPFVIDAALVGGLRMAGMVWGTARGQHRWRSGTGGGWFAPLVLILLLWLLPRSCAAFAGRPGCAIASCWPALALVAMVLPLDGALRIVDVLLLATALGQAHGLIPNRLLTSGT
jgi:hypothetical protein